MKTWVVLDEFGCQRGFHYTREWYADYMAYKYIAGTSRAFWQERGGWKRIGSLRFVRVQEQTPEFFPDPPCVPERRVVVLSSAAREREESGSLADQRSP